MHLAFSCICQAIIWDIISNLDSDYHLIHDFPLSYTIFVYFNSRVATFVAFMIASVASTRPMNDCSGILSALSWAIAVSISSTSLLYFFRVRALYMQNRYVVGFFFLLWIAVVAGCIALGIQGRNSTNLGSSPYCIADTTDSVIMVVSINIIPMINNVLSFIAATWKLMENAHVEANFKNRFKLIIFGHYLPEFSRALLKDNQIYFLSVVVNHVITVSIFYDRGGFRPNNVALVFANVAVMNLMGGRIYRNTRLGIRSFSHLQAISSPSQPVAFRATGTDNTTSEIV
ncbi:hypothetical protein CPB84DRAFT_1681618 [Gymnopilus junonius]|uniref:Uncharacterized protein n=1 Tax=Gymnopilus junonius TaxID=109634 RepID=A0A9P5NNY7_GYMJU|nr:hypothetical protein CPB84DRAFT_1681618 [Gymnopilus junonius]